MPAGDRRPADEVLKLVLGEVEQRKRRDRRALLHQSKATLKAVEDQLGRAGVLGPKGRRMVVLDREAVAQVPAKARRILAGDSGGAGTDVPGAALVALASVIPLNTVLGRRHKRQDQERAGALTHRVDERVPGFERLIAQMRRTRRRSYSADGPVHGQEQPEDGAPGWRHQRGR